MTTKEEIKSESVKSEKPIFGIKKRTMPKKSRDTARDFHGERFQVTTARSQVARRLGYDAKSKNRYLVWDAMSAQIVISTSTRKTAERIAEAKNGLSEGRKDYADRMRRLKSKTDVYAVGGNGFSMLERAAYRIERRLPKKSEAALSLVKMKKGG